MATRKAYRSHMRAYYGWLREEGHREDDPTERIPSIRVPRGLPRPIPEADLRLALNAAPPRMRAWLLLMAFAGLRCCEVSRLRPCDLQDSLRGKVLFLRECKGGGQATVPAADIIIEQLERLPIRNGLWWGVLPHQVSSNVSVYLRGLGIDATAHQLRHFAGTTWYENSGHDLLTTAQLLRHVDVSTTQTYAQINPERPAEVVRATTFGPGPQTGMAS